MMRNNSLDRSGLTKRQDKLFTAAYYWHFKFYIPNSVHGHCGDFLLVFFFLKQGFVHTEELTSSIIPHF